MHEAIDDDQIVEIFSWHSLDVMEEIVKCHTSSKHCIGTFIETSHEESGERTFGEFMAAGWHELTEEAVDIPDCFLCPFVLGNNCECSWLHMYAVHSACDSNQQFVTIRMMPYINFGHLYVV